MPRELTVVSSTRRSPALAGASRVVGDADRQDESGGRGREGESQQVHAEAEKVDPLTSEGGQIEGRAAVDARTPDAHGLQDGAAV